MKTTRDSNSVRFYRLQVSYQNTLVVTAGIIRKWIGWDSNWVPAPIKAKHQNERKTDLNGRSPLSLFFFKLVLCMGTDRSSCWDSNSRPVCRLSYEAE